MVLILIMELSHLWPDFHAPPVGPQKFSVSMEYGFYLCV